MRWIRGWQTKQGNQERGSVCEAFVLVVHTSSAVPHLHPPESCSLKYVTPSMISDSTSLYSFCLNTSTWVGCGGVGGEVRTISEDHMSECRG